jgi:hypothetical protein
MNFSLRKLLQTSDHDQNRPLVFWVLTLLVILGVFTADGPWEGRIGGFALVMGVLVMLSPGVVSLPRIPAILALLFLLLGWGAFFPAEWFGTPGWRSDLAKAGVETGDRVAIQARSAFEGQFYFVLMFLAGLWVTSLRTSARVLRTVAWVFVLGVAGYAVLSQILVGEIQSSRGEHHFGFFPNRNHTSTYLALGFVCSLGLVFQAIRNRHFFKLGVTLVAGGLILWAVFNWNISRAGIVLCLAGGILWVASLGFRYFGRQELKLLGLVIILGGGVFGLSELRVKERLATTVERVSDASAEVEDPLSEGGKGRKGGMMEVDFRVPMALDTLKMIGEAPLTGVGAGQYRWVFPQYRAHTAVQDYSVALHPESSWLWLAAELGLPAMLVLLVLTGWFFYGGVRNIRKAGARDRALRMGCLVAAFLVPLHGLFDVPAHRPVLVLASLLLYALSQNPPNRRLGEGKRGSFPRIGSLLTGLILMSAGGLVLGGAWFGWRAPMRVKADRDLAAGADLYRQVTDPKPGLGFFDLLKRREEIRSLAGDAIADSPLDGRLYRLRGLAALPMQFESAAVSRDFEIDRLLIPFSVRIPMIHAATALSYDEEEAAKAWREAIVRSEALDERKGGGTMRARTVREIQSQVKRVPQLKDLSETIIRTP